MKYPKSEFLLSIFKEPMQYFQNHHYRSKHHAIDVVPPNYTDDNFDVVVYAPFNAHVVSARNISIGAAGKAVYLESIEHNDKGTPKWSLYMCHFHNVIAITGSKILAGTPIGLLGNSGNCLGHFPHVHLRLGYYCRAGRNEIGCLSFYDLIDCFDMTATPLKYY